MNSIDFRNLQEAYSNVYENEQLDEISADLALAASKKADIARGKAAVAGDKGKAVEKMQQASRLYTAQAKKRLNKEQMGDEESQMGGSGTTAPPVDKKKEMLAKQQLANLRTIQQKKQQLERQKLNLQKQSKLPLNSEEFESDVFDSILEHLVTKGYADTNERALVIMANMSEEWRENILDEATAMAKRGLNEPEIRNKIAAKTSASGAGQSADRATALADRETYGNKEMKTGREKLARAQRGTFRDTTSSKPGLQGYGFKSNDPAVKAKQDARGNQRARVALTPNERKQLNMEFDLYDSILEHLVVEGYADTNESALVIMANMSEEWRESIVEGVMPYPQDKVDKKIEATKRKEGTATFQRKPEESDKQYKRGIAMRFQKKMSDIGYGK